MGPISLSQCTCYIVRGRALGICQGWATHFAALWLCMWESGQRGNNASRSPLTPLSVTSPLPASNWRPSSCCPGADSLSGLACVCSRIPWAPQMDSSERVAVFSTGATTIGHWNPGLHGLPHSLVVLPVCPHTNVGLLALPATTHLVG